MSHGVASTLSILEGERGSFLGVGDFGVLEKKEVREDLAAEDFLAGVDFGDLDGVLAMVASFWVLTAWAAVEVYMVLWFLSLGI